MSRVLIKSLYLPDEVVILDEWFAVPNSERDIEADVVASLERLNCAGTFPSWYDPTAAAVARILLSPVARTLPDWVAVHADGEIISARRSASEAYKAHRQVAFMPRYLFSINWADSGPGFSWPMAYYATWVPGYDQHVVTSSSDSSEGNHGFCDLALASIAKDADLLASAAGIIESDWCCQYLDWDQQQWQCVLDAGLIPRDAVEAMGRSVWEPEEIMEN